MSHFAKVCDGKVLRVIVAEKEFFDTFVDNEPGDWIQTSYNTRGNRHYNPETGEDDSDINPPLRGNYAGIGYTYDRDNDVFYPPAPHPSMVLNQETWKWELPPKPDEELDYYWDTENNIWKLVETEE